MASQSFLVIVHDDGRPTEVMLPDGRLGVLFPRSSDDSDHIFYGMPVIGGAVFHRMENGSEDFIFRDVSLDEARKELLYRKEDIEGWDLVERTTVTFR